MCRGAPALALLLLAATARAHAGACDHLHATYNGNGGVRAVSVHGAAAPVRVYWVGSAPSRAAAALLVAAARHALRLAHVELLPAASLCRLARQLRPLHNVLDHVDEVALVPAGEWGGAEDGCDALGQALSEAPPRLRALDAGPAPRRLRLHAHLATHARNVLCISYIRWLYYSDLSKLASCGFQDTEILFYYPMEWKESALELKKHSIAAGVPLRPTAMKAERSAILQNQNTSFLFLDYDMWTGVQQIQVVELPPGPPLALDLSTVRMADVNILRTVAPKLLKLYNAFDPTVNDLREVLQIESNHSVNIEEAACVWATRRSTQFKKWSEFAKRYGSFYEAAIFLCDNDPDWYEYKNAMDEIKNIYDATKSTSSPLMLKFSYIRVDCGDEHKLMRQLIERTQSAYWARLVGALAAGAGAAAAAGAARALDTPLLVYDVPAELLHPRARAVSAAAPQLARALAHFIARCGWSRIVLLSEDTKMAKNLFESLNANVTLNLLNIPVDPIEPALQTVKRVGGKIVFLNANAATAEAVLCEASDLGMTSDAGYVWIVREWFVVEDAPCAGRSLSTRHFTVSFWWRGGSEADGGAVSRALERRWRGRAWPLHAAPLADAVTLLLHSFDGFMRNYPQRQDDLHGGNATGLLWETMDTLSIPGVTQTLKLDKHGLVNPLAYVHQWNGNKHELVETWKFSNNDIKVERQERPIFKEGVPPDGSSSCLTSRTGERFTGGCADGAVLGGCGAALLALPLLLAARRLRRERQARRDNELTARLLARGERAAAALADHLVDRAHLQLHHELGAGRFGRVWFAKLRPPGRAPTAVAAKALREEVSPAEEREFLNEACVLASLRHEHVVRLVGVCATGGPPLLLMEHAFYGDLLQYLRARRHLARVPGDGGDGGDGAEARHVGAAALTRLAREAAAALAHLAARGVVHRDVRAANCLVDARRSLKLADFGMARRARGADGAAEYSCRRRGLFPVLWMAPESLERGVFTAASDAWALGVLLLELVTLGARPYGAWPPLRVLRYVCTGGRPPLPPDASADTQRVLARCWRRAPGERLTAAALGAELAACPELLRPALMPVSTHAADAERSLCQTRYRLNFLRYLLNFYKL